MVFFSFFHGFWLSFGLIVAIGAQNAFILRQGLLRYHIFILCFVAGLCDALLIILGVLGFGSFIRSQPSLIMFVKYGGVIFLIAYSFLAFRRAYYANSLVLCDTSPKSLRPTLAILLAFTFLNPHVYLDTVVLLGAVSLHYHDIPLILFTLGASLASFSWFFALGYGARVLAPIFTRPLAWRILDILIGFIMLCLAFLVSMQ